MRRVYFFGHDVQRLLLFLKFLLENSPCPLRQLSPVFGELIKINVRGYQKPMH